MASIAKHRLDEILRIFSLSSCRGIFCISPLLSAMPRSCLVCGSLYAQDEKKLQAEAKEFEEKADTGRVQASGARTRRVPIARKTAAALVATAAASAAEAAECGQLVAWQQRAESNDDWKWMLVGTILVIYAVAWMVHSFRKPNVAVEIRASNRSVMTQSMVTYTSLRGAATPRFTPLAEDLQGVWRDGLRDPDTFQKF